MSETTLAFVSFGFTITFIIIIMRRYLSPIAALLIIPLFLLIVLGQLDQTGEFVIDGVGRIVPTLLTLIFAVLYFAIMIDRGLFEPVVRIVVRFAGNDPTKIMYASVILPGIIALDGSGTTAALISLSALLPIFNRLGLNKLMLVTLLVLSDMMAHIVPWGSPMIRVSGALHLDSGSFYPPLIPPILITFVSLFGIAYWFGRKETARLAALPGGLAALPSFHADDRPAYSRKDRMLFVFNLSLTFALVVVMATAGKALAVAVMIAFVIALTVNYPRLSDQAKFLASHADRTLTVALLIIGAGAFTGIMTGSGALDAMANLSLTVMPDWLGDYMAPITAALSVPLTFMLSNDAFYFGVLPLFATMGQEHQIPVESIARAALIGQPLHAFSPLIAGIYFCCGLAKIEFGELQAFAIPWALLVSIIFFSAAWITGAF